MLKPGKLIEAYVAGLVSDDEFISVSCSMARLLIAEEAIRLNESIFSRFNKDHRIVAALSSLGLADLFLDIAAKARPSTASSERPEASSGAVARPGNGSSVSRSARFSSGVNI
ncbi:MAG TPA: hypothetical protein VG713_13755 [Pirellulales bacterium]|nr:hypothetical protein [Pirellulales bacterium]